MALLDKGISVYNPTTGETQTINLYTTQEEVGTPYKEFAYNGEVVYVAITQDKDAAYATDFKFDNADGTWYVCTQPGGGGIDPTNGTLDIEGNLELSEDFKVNGNVTVSGNVTGTGTLSATGTIAVSGSTEATVKAGATLSECDISIDDGTTTFNSDTTVADGKVSVGGTGVTNAADCVVYCDMEIESSKYGVYQPSEATFTVEDNVILNITSASACLYSYCLSNAYQNSIITTIKNNAVLNLTSTASICIDVNDGSTFIIEENAVINIAADTRGIFVGGLHYPTFTVGKGTSITITESTYGLYIQGGSSNSGNSGGAIVTISDDTIINIRAHDAGIYALGAANDGDSAITISGNIAIDSDDFGIYQRASNGAITSTISTAATVYIKATNFGLYHTTSTSGVVSGDTKFTINGHVTIVSSGTGIYNGVTSRGTTILTINGSVDIEAVDGVYNDATLNGTGTIIVNGSPYSF